jgi:hypothetical protein
MEEGIKRTNIFYGGLSPDVTQVFLTHGEMDPQRSLGPSEDLNESSPVAVSSVSKTSVRILFFKSSGDVTAIFWTRFWIIF